MPIFGVVIRMFYKEHEPPHFHAEHHGQLAKFDLDGKMIAGSIQSRTALRLIRGWARVAVRCPMTFLPIVTAAEYRGGHRIHVTFNDGTQETVDFGQWLDGPVFEPLKSSVYFRKFFLDGGTVAWPNGADIAPETLYATAPQARGRRRLRPVQATEPRRPRRRPGR